jgi:hypothetical protein
MTAHMGFVRATFGSLSAARGDAGGGGAVVRCLLRVLAPHYDGEEAFDHRVDMPWHLQLAEVARPTVLP